MRPAKYFYDKPFPKYLDPKTVLIYLPHPVYLLYLVPVRRLRRWGRISRSFVSVIPSASAQTPALGAHI
jgi:hypothetical protein